MGERTGKDRMKQYDVTCPFCGTVNKGLFLEEPHGWMICEKCQGESMSYKFITEHMKKVPVLTFEQLAKLSRAGVANK